MERSLLVQSLLDMATGSGSAKLEALVVDAAGTFDAGSGKGYNPVTVPSGTVNVLGEKGVVSNNSVVVTPKAQVGGGWVDDGEASGPGVSVTASELVSGTLNVSSAGETDVTNYQKVSVPSGSHSASATKGAVSNHSVTVTPRSTATQGFVQTGTVEGVGVSVAASELVSGSETYTENGTYDVTNLRNVQVNVPTESWITERTYTWSADTNYTGTLVDLFAPTIPANCTKLRLTFDGSVQCPGSGTLRLGLAEGFGTNAPTITISISTVGSTYPVIPIKQEITSQCYPNMRIYVTYGTTVLRGVFPYTVGTNNHTALTTDKITAVTQGDSVTVKAGSTLTVEYMTT